MRNEIMKRMNVDKVNIEICTVTMAPIDMINVDIPSICNNIAMRIATLLSFGGHDYSIDEINCIFGCQGVLELCTAQDPTAEIYKQVIESGYTMIDDEQDIVNSVGKYITDHRTDDAFVRMVNDFKEYIDQFKHDISEGEAMMCKLGMVSHISYDAPSDAPSSMYV